MGKKLVPDLFDEIILSVNLLVLVSAVRDVRKEFRSRTIYIERRLFIICVISLPHHIVLLSAVRDVRKKFHSRIYRENTLFIMRPFTPSFLATGRRSPIYI